MLHNNTQCTVWMIDILNLIDGRCLDQLATFACDGGNFARRACNTLSQCPYVFYWVTWGAGDLPSSAAPPFQHLSTPSVPFARGLRLPVACEPIACDVTQEVFYELYP